MFICFSSLCTCSCLVLQAYCTEDILPTSSPDGYNIKKISLNVVSLSSKISAILPHNFDLFLSIEYICCTVVFV